MAEPRTTQLIKRRAPKVGHMQQLERLKVYTDSASTAKIPPHVADETAKAKIPSLPRTAEILGPAAKNFPPYRDLVFGEIEFRQTTAGAMLLDLHSTHPRVTFVIPRQDIPTFDRYSARRKRQQSSRLWDGAQDNRTFRISRDMSHSAWLLRPRLFFEATFPILQWVSPLKPI